MAHMCVSNAWNAGGGCAAGGRAAAQRLHRHRLVAERDADADVREARQGEGQLPQEPQGEGSAGLCTRRAAVASSRRLALL